MLKSVLLIARGERWDFEPPEKCVISTKVLWRSTPSYAVVPQFHQQPAEWMTHEGRWLQKD